MVDWIITHWIGASAIVLAIIRLIESILQWWNTQETKTALQAMIKIIQNFLFDIETYKGVEK